VVSAALHANRRRFDVVYVEKRHDDQRLQRLAGVARRRKIEIRFSTRATLDGLAGGPGHGGVVAYAGPRPWDDLPHLAAALKRARAPLVVALEGVEDPFNFGRILRSAEAGGATAVLTRLRDWGESAEDISRVSAGAYERLPLIGLPQLAGALHGLRQRGLAVLAAVPDGARPSFAADLARPVVLVIGGERRGLSKLTLAACQQTIAIPMARATQSLAVCDAAAILIYEVGRQRHEPGAAAGPEQEQAHERSLGPDRLRRGRRASSRTSPRRAE